MDNIKKKQNQFDDMAIDDIAFDDDKLLESIGNEEENDEALFEDDIEDDVFDTTADEDGEQLEDEEIDFGIPDEEEGDETEDEIIDFGLPTSDDEIADDVGVAVDIEDSGLKDDSDNVEIISKHDNSFISSTGDIVVQDKDDNGENFKLTYIDIAQIAVTERIRKSNDVDSLVQSIKSTGLLKPIVVAPLMTEGYYALIDGYRRILACAKAGLKNVPCIINTKVATADIPILEALYNHAKKYSIKEMVDYIDYLEKEKGILSASMIEYLLQMDSGDYTKLKDILNDDDEDIVSALMNGQMTIGQAFKKLEQRRKKESKEEQEKRKAEQVYGDTEESGASQIAGSGEEGDESVALTDDEIAALSISQEDIEATDDKDLDTMVEESKQIEGFEPNQQDYKHREILDPALRKSVLVRDKNTCQCCGLSGQEYTEVLDIHHKVEVYLGGSDDIDNLVTTCIVCHKLIHLHGRGELHIRPTEELTPEEQTKFKRVVLFGNKIREGMAMKKMKKEDLKKVDKAETIGRTKPGTPRQIAT